jgi:outer membrane immunogenic protein
VGLENSTSYKGGVYSLTQVSCDPSICGPGFNYTNSVKTPWLNTTMARLGVTVTDRFLVYLTGGLAVTQLQIENVSNFGPGSSLSTKETRWAVGYAAGLGVEYAFAGNWSAKLEGIYSDLGSQRFQYASADPTFGKFNSWTSDGLKEIFLRTAINYRF